MFHETADVQYPHLSSSPFAPLASLQSVANTCSIRTTSRHSQSLGTIRTSSDSSHQHTTRTRLQPVDTAQHTQGGMRESETNKRNDVFTALRVGTVVETLWESDQQWHSGTVVSHDTHTGYPILLYLCGRVDVLDPDYVQGATRLRVVKDGVNYGQRRRLIFRPSDPRIIHPDKLATATENETTSSVVCSEWVQEVNGAAPPMIVSKPCLMAPGETGVVEKVTNRSSSRGDVVDGIMASRRRKRLRLVHFLLGDLWRRYFHKDKMELRTRMRAVLRQAGMSQRVLSKSIRCAQSTFSLWLSGSSSNHAYAEKKLKNWIERDITSVLSDEVDSKQTEPPDGNSKKRKRRRL